jgi:hypothetical protein
VSWGVAITMRNSEREPFNASGSFRRRSCGAGSRDRGRGWRFFGCVRLLGSGCAVACGDVAMAFPADSDELGRAVPGEVDLTAKRAQPGVGARLGLCCGRAWTHQ